MIYEGSKTKNISFPLGSIGTGSVALLGNGALGDFKIFGRPNKNTGFGYTFFSARAESESGSRVKVLAGDTNESLMENHSSAGWRGFGPAFDSMAVFTLQNPSLCSANRAFREGECSARDLRFIMRS